MDFKLLCRLGHLGESGLFVFVFFKRIILIEALFAKITSEVLFKLHFQNTHIGLVDLTKRVICFLPMWLPVPGYR